ncbi:hypothetical protein [Vibrio cortegadensis]|uniref:hypothetical protein n=1 Tax=Vibrio cortegadensis TaxID=1328770 RepID=UPI00352F55C2
MKYIKYSDSLETLTLEQINDTKLVEAPNGELVFFRKVSHIVCMENSVTCYDSGYRLLASFIIGEHRITTKDVDSFISVIQFFNSLIGEPLLKLPNGNYVRRQDLGGFEELYNGGIALFDHDAFIIDVVVAPRPAAIDMLLEELELCFEYFICEGCYQPDWGEVYSRL